MPSRAPTHMPWSLITNTFSVVLVVVLLLSRPLCSKAGDDECSKEQGGTCYDKKEALQLKVVGIVTIFIASMIGVCLPLFTQSVRCLRPEHDLFIVVKAVSSGVILSSGFVHVLPIAFRMLGSPCLPEKPWHEFPFAAFVAMISALFTLMLDSFMMTFQHRRQPKSAQVLDHATPNSADMPPSLEAHNPSTNGFDVPPESGPDSIDEASLARYRTVAQVLEMGIVVHSVVIGLSMGTLQTPCTLKPLIVAMCFHQLFEGMGLGGSILQAMYKLKMRAIMVFFFSTTTPFGIVLGIALSNVYNDNSPVALSVIGLLNASSSGLLIHMALVDLLAADFLGPKVIGKVKLQIWGYIAVLLGAGGMSVLAKWV